MVEQDRNQSSRATPEADAAWMRQALDLAEASTGLASPNPRVGCVIVKRGKALGRGMHVYDQKSHAEIVALREAGSAARGATAYVTLEPCSHTGRTGPCADALLAAGITRVVVATGDPNPLVNGRGLARLRRDGVAVTSGVLAEEARALNEGFARWVRTGTPFVLLKAGLSLDGRIAPPRTVRPPGSVVYLTGEQSLSAVQRLRHSVDAVLTGIGTVLEDNPLLTDRSGSRRRRPLLRIVLDSHLRLPVESRLAAGAQADVLVLTSQAEDPAKARRRAALEAAGIEVLAIPSSFDGRLDLAAALRSLGQQRGILNVMAEGGSRLNQTLLAGDAPIADKLCLFYAPVFLGQDGIPLISGATPPRPALQRLTSSQFGRDFCLQAYLRDPWSDLVSDPGSETEAEPPPVA